MSQFRRIGKSSELDLQLDLFRDFRQRCWEARLHHQRMKAMIAVSTASICAMLLTASGILRAAGTSTSALDLASSSALICALAAAYFYFRYQEVRIYQYDAHLRLADREFGRLLGVDHVPNIAELLGHSTRCSSRCAKWLVRLANAMLLVVLACIALLPSARVDASRGLVAFTWQSGISILFFLAIVATGWVLAARARSRVRVAHGDGAVAGVAGRTGACDGFHRDDGG